MTRSTDLRVGINGFGRIGRAVARILLQRRRHRIVHVNDLNPDIQNLAYLLKYDTTYGRLPDAVTAEGEAIAVGDQRFSVTHTGDLGEVDWAGSGVDVVIEATGVSKNEHQATARNLISQYARRMTIEQRLAEIIRSFCADALSSTVNLNADLDIMLCVLAQALLAAFRTRLGAGYATATPDTLQRRFLDSSGTITTTGDQVTVRIDRRAYSPVLRKADLPPATTIPWWGNRTLRYEFT